MIKYALRCSHAHEFEAWFNSSKAFEEQKSGGLLGCPVCGDSSIEKTLMAPNVVTSKAKAKSPATHAVGTPPSGPAPPVPSSAAYAPPSTPPDQARLVEAMRELRKKIEAATEDVGPKFAEEARKIHYSEVEPRGIRGEATSQEVQDLEEEGIAIAPLPRLPDDHN